MMAETCKGVFTYFYFKVVTLDRIIIHLNIKQCDGSRYLQLRFQVLSKMNLFSFYLYFETRLIPTLYIILHVGMGCGGITPNVEDICTIFKHREVLPTSINENMNPFQSEQHLYIIS
jgi:hypothetical protein